VSLILHHVSTDSSKHLNFVIIVILRVRIAKREKRPPPTRGFKEGSF